MFAKFLVSFALFLSESPKYLKIKGFFRNLFENPHFKLKRYFDILMIFIVLSSIVLLIQEVKQTLDPWLVFYNYTIVTVIFLVEYILRLWIYNDIHTLILKEHDKASYLNQPLPVFKLITTILAKKFEFVRSPSAIIDILAILPSYRPLRVLRVFLLFRVVKILRYTQSIQIFLRVLYAKKFELSTLVIFVGFIIFISAVLLYIFEGNGQNSSLTNFWDAIYWALVTMATVGYGDITPVTFEGQVVAMLVIIAGIGVVSFATSIIVSEFSEKLGDMQIDDTLKRVEVLQDIHLILGYSTMARELAMYLQKDAFNVVVLDTDHMKVKQALKDGFFALHADATKLETYHEMNLNQHHKIKACMCLIDNEVQNIFITLTLRSIHPELKIYTKANSHSLVKKLKLAGAYHVFHSYETMAKMAKVYISHPVVFDTMNSLISTNGDYGVKEIYLTSLSSSVGKCLQEMDFKSMKLLLLGVARKEQAFIFNPKADFTFKEHDTLVVIGHNIALEEFTPKVIIPKKRRR